MSLSKKSSIFVIRIFFYITIRWIYEEKKCEFSSCLHYHHFQKKKSMCFAINHCGVNLTKKSTQFKIFEFLGHHSNVILGETLNSFIYLFICVKKKHILYVHIFRKNEKKWCVTLSKILLHSFVHENLFIEKSKLPFNLT